MFKFLIGLFLGVFIGALATAVVSANKYDER